MKRFHIISLQNVILFFLKFKKLDEDSFIIQEMDLTRRPPRKFSQRIYAIDEIGPGAPKKSVKLT